MYLSFKTKSMRREMVDMPYGVGHTFLAPKIAIETGMNSRYLSPIQLAQPTSHQEIPIQGLHIIGKQGRALVKPEGIYASEQQGPYGRFFGRDTFITALLHLKALEMLRPLYGIQREGVPTQREAEEEVRLLWNASRPIFDNIAREDSKDHGIMKGQIPHEQGRPEENFPVLWYPTAYRSADDETKAINYDTVDAPGYGILFADKMMQLLPESSDYFLPHMRAMTEWAIRNMDNNGGLIGYTGATQAIEKGERRALGLDTHHWQDGKYSLIDETKESPEHPVRTLLEQVLYWKALQVAADRLASTDEFLSHRARNAAKKLKDTFNEKFLFDDEKGKSVAYAIAGEKQQIRIDKVSVDFLMALEHNHNGETIFYDESVMPQLIRRAIDELYTPIGGLRTQSTESLTHESNIYHGPNSFWPHAQTMAMLGLLSESKRTAQGNPQLGAEYHFYALHTALATAGVFHERQSPVELVLGDGNGGITVFREYNKERDEEQQGSGVQAWAGAASRVLHATFLSMGRETIRVSSFSRTTTRAEKEDRKAAA